MDATGWTESTVKTYMSKQWADVLQRGRGGLTYVRPEFQRLSREAFLELVTQKRQIFATYRRVKYEDVVTYEFLLPLTREDQLRNALDDLFYTDTIERRLIEIGLEKVAAWAPRDSDESEQKYIRRVCQLVSEKFGGYSVGHVNGRFRAATVASRADAAAMLQANERYLVDETTAVVRFIIPVKASKQVCEDSFDEFSLEESGPSESGAELSQIQSLFFHLFVEAVCRTVKGEDEIWLVEDTGTARRLYVWEKS